MLHHENVKDKVDIARKFKENMDIRDNLKKRKTRLSYYNVTTRLVDLVGLY